MMDISKLKPKPRRLIKLTEQFTLQSLNGYWVIKETAISEKGLPYEKQSLTYASLKQACEKLLELYPSLTMAQLKDAVRASHFALEKELNF